MSCLSSYDCASHNSPQLILIHCTCVNSVVNGEIKVPRTCGKETTRENVPSSNAEEYFKRVIVISIVDYFISELELKFNPGFYRILPMEGLIPSKNAIHNDNDIHAALKYNRLFKSSEFQSKSDFKVWRAKWESVVRLVYFVRKRRGDWPRLIDTDNLVKRTKLFE
ncbi:hypothetical protein AVEN_18047-1 [Araneus ventricosus]|uniref:Uncharacterized protein n=1 Tax=Araneus ventricosus TaxID=182803 RepID=A0A4Y2SHV6_ARAVE|nr:hypothetical protein AVEN_18047-1 [Araneus ventricosus]